MDSVSIVPESFREKAVSFDLHEYIEPYRERPRLDRLLHVAVTTSDTVTRTRALTLAFDTLRMIPDTTLYTETIDRLQARCDWNESSDAVWIQRTQHAMDDAVESGYGALRDAELAKDENGAKRALLSLGHTTSAAGYIAWALQYYEAGKPQAWSKDREILIVQLDSILKLLLEHRLFDLPRKSQYIDVDVFFSHAMQRIEHTFPSTSLPQYVNFVKTVGSVAEAGTPQHTMANIVMFRAMWEFVHENYDAAAIQFLRCGNNFRPGRISVRPESVQAKVSAMW